MPKRSSDHPLNVVPHPRYGAQSVSSGFKVPLEVIRRYLSYFSNRRAYFPESAIPADESRQNYTVVPRLCYVDELRRCRKCDRDYIFFAREQQFWYEVLRFYVFADCVHCPECRRSNHKLRQRFQRYARSIGQAEISDENLATVVEDATFLFEAGVLRNEQKLRRLKNLAKARIPTTEASRAIVALIAEIEGKRDKAND